MLLGEISETVLVDDGVSEALTKSLNQQLVSELSDLSVLEAKHRLLSDAGSEWARSYRDGLTSEAIAAIVKVMTHNELSSVAGSLFNPLPGEGITIGSPEHFGSRIQPNSPGDDEEEVLFSILEGLSYGCGDVILGVNPASDSLETIVRLEELLRRVVERLELPTKYCVLSDIVKQEGARSHTKVDVGFQSLAGTSKALGGMVGLDVDGVLDLAQGFDGLYFETGQGAEVTNGTAEGVDMVTLEARTYGIARHIQQRTGSWMIVNDVAGFIGPEVFSRGDQLLRACLEDMVIAKLHGITMGLDVCSTFHMGIEPRALQGWTQDIVEQAAPAYLMAVAGNADPMLGYLTTSFRQHPLLRGRTARKMTTAMESRLKKLGVVNQAGAPIDGGGTTARLYATYQRNGGDTRAAETLREEGVKKIKALQERGYDLGYGCDQDYAAPPEVQARLQRIYEQARKALHAKLDNAVISKESPRHLRVRTRALDREGYLAHPSSGELIRDQDAEQLTRLYPSRRPQVQMVISDGLNANAINETLQTLLPPLRRGLAETSSHLGRHDVIIDNGRVRAGYHVGALLGVDVVIHLIGERPGTGLNTLSAYLTYGRDKVGHSRWNPNLDHSCTSAICGIHQQGKLPGLAADEIVRCVKRMLEERASGVALGSDSSRSLH